MTAEGGATIAGALSVEIVADERLSYALSHNRRAPVREVVVRNPGVGVSGPLTVTIGSSWTASDVPPLRPLQIVIDTPAAGQAVIVDTAASRLDDQAMAHLDAAAPAEIMVTVTSEDGVLATASTEVTVLARNQWRSDLRELTAAFVQPNHPEVAGILADASRHLAAATGSGALDGYQSGERSRAVAIGEAIFSALRSRVQNYVEIPAGGDEEWGQLVRPLDQVLEHRQGNCIELACAYASCLEQAGLSPVIFFVHGHAFAGFLTDAPDGEPASNRWSTPLTTELAAVMNLVDRPGLVVTVETTLIPSDAGVEFAQAVEQSRGHFAQRSVRCEVCARLAQAGAPPEFAPHMHSALDVVEAHRSGVRPLPARMVAGNVVTIVIDNGPAEPVYVERRDAATMRLLPDTVPARVQQWKNALLDLSRRNPLISFKAADRGIALVPPMGALGAIEDHLVDGKSIQLPGVDDISPVLRAAGIDSVQQIEQDDLAQQWRASQALFGFVARGTVERRARDLISKAKTEEQDTGVNNLHLALGSLTWPAGDGGAAATVTSPVFLVPVRMALKRGQRVPVITLDPGSMTTVNHCLIEALRSKHGVALPWFSQDMRDDSGLDVLEGLKQLRSALLESGLADRGFHVRDDASVGLFRFNKVRLWKDLDEHWEQFLSNPVVRHLVDGVQGGFADPADPEGTGIPEHGDATLFNPQPADGAQTRAIVRALAGQSFVLEGPPGTGKSQTITNLLANALAEGKKVLFVAEKQPALAVVKERLEAVGLDPFCLDLHDKGSTPEAIKTQLRDALDFAAEAPLDRWEKAQAAFEVASGTMAAYRERLHGPNRAGASYFDAHDTLLTLGDGPVAEAGRAIVDLDREHLDSLRRLMLELPSLTGPAQPSPGHPWSFAGDVPFGDLDRQRVAAAIVRLEGGLRGLPDAGPWADAVATCADAEALSAVAAAALLDAGGSLPSGAQWRDVAREDWAATALGCVNAARGALSTASALDPAFGPEMLARDFAAQRASMAQAASSFPLGRKGRVRAALGELSASPAFASGDVSSTFTQLTVASDAYRSALAMLRGQTGLAIGPIAAGTASRTDLDAIEVRIGHLVAVARSVTSGTKSGTALASAVDGFTSAPPAEPLADLRDGLGELWAACGATDDTIRAWLADRDLSAAITASLSAWRTGVDGLSFIGLRRWLELVAALAPLDEAGLQGFRAQLLRGEISGEDAGDALERALLHATLTVIGEEHEFDVFDSASHDRAVSRFVSLLNERQALLRSVIPAMLHRSRSFDASSTIGAVGSLRSELNAKRRGARSVRDLLTKYPDLITELTPCFLMSPDSVAKFLVPGKIRFDLAVFDEASQIRVAEAIGAMGRAGAVVIVGDSRQMPPSSAFASAGAAPSDAIGQVAEDELLVIPEDEESILEECVESGLPREMLAWHYRSRDEVLIHFSNEHYYEGRLASFPSPFSMRPDCGLVYHRVEGQFHHGSKGASDPEFQTNPIEADAIVAEVRRRAHDPVLSKLSMGVVTLNARQQELVRAKLTELDDPSIVELLDSEDPERELFVLNLESVQGRERDVIILGTSFSKRASGGAMPLNFGPLNQQRGERRLNVAVTRARRQVVIFSSFDPSELDRATSVGLLHLREYLELAKRASQDRSSLDDAAAAGAPDRYVEDVAAALRERGLAVRTRFGLSSFKVDLAVGLPEDPRHWMVGVLLDGREWGKRELALDRDALPTTVLRHLMDWPAIARVWLPAWRRDPGLVIDEIEDLVRSVAAGIGPALDSTEAPEPEAAPAAVSDTMSPEPGPAVTEAPVESSASARLALGTRPYVQWQTNLVLGSPDDLAHNDQAINQLLRECAATEGPLLLDDALRKVARAFGVEKARAARLDAMRPAVPAELVVDTPFGIFLFPAGVDTSRPLGWYRRTTFAQRSLPQIAPHETAEAARQLAMAAHSVAEDELAAELLTHFGYGRKTADTIEQARARLRWAVDHGYLVAHGAVIQPPP